MQFSGQKIKSDIHGIQSSLTLTLIHAKLFVQRRVRLQTSWSVMLGRISCNYFGTSSNTQTMATHIKGTQVYAARESSTATIRQNAQRKKTSLKQTLTGLNRFLDSIWNVHCIDNT